MSYGNLGKLTAAGGTFEVLATIPNGIQFATVFIYALNPTVSNKNIKIAVGTGASPAATDHIQGELPLEANGGTYEFPALIVHPNEKIFVSSNQPGVVFNVRGITQT